MVECLDLGSKELGIEYSFYKKKLKFIKIVVVNSGIDNLKFCIKKKRCGQIDFIVGGPNLVITPNDLYILTNKNIDLVITPSKCFKFLF